MRGAVPPILGFMVGLLLWTASGGAHPCPAESETSPCIDVDSLWLVPGAGPFLTVPGARLRKSGELTLSFGSSFVRTPARLLAPSPDPSGRTVELVRQQLSHSVLADYVLEPRVAVSLALPFALAREGTGIEGITSSEKARLPGAALRDPRLGATFTLFDFKQRWRLAVAVRYVVTIPWGDATHLAGDRSLTSAPSLVAEGSRGLFFSSVELGARLREPITLGDLRFGTDVHAGLGLGMKVPKLPGKLSLSGELRVTPSLVHQRAATTNSDSARLIPAEWMATLQATPVSHLTVLLGMGSGLPLSSRSTESGREQFAAPSSPSFRGTLVLRIQLGAFR